jgi:hypothetical protein
MLGVHLSHVRIMSGMVCHLASMLKPRVAIGQGLLLGAL